MARRDFPWDTRLALKLAFYRTLAAPRVAEVLHRSGKLIEQPRKRADDTSDLIFQLVDAGFEHPQGRLALRRINAIHAQHQIADDEFRYVLAAFVVVPIRWLRRHGRRLLRSDEIRAVVAFYHTLGERMGITKVPRSYEEFEAYLADYERRRVYPSDKSKELLRATGGQLREHFPRALRWAADALLAEATPRNAGLKPPPWWAGLLLSAGLAARKAFLRLTSRPSVPANRWHHVSRQ
jgi:hypothetical protein